MNALQRLAVRVKARNEIRKTPLEALYILKSELDLYLNEIKKKDKKGI